MSVTAGGPIVGIPAAGVREYTVRTDDGAVLAVTAHRPSSDADGVAVVLAHGWAASRRVWHEVRGLLLGLGYPVVCYDQRGHGHSTTGREPIGIERLAGDLAAVLESVEEEKVVLCGHSGGGFAAMAYAVADPERAGARLRGMALLATAAHDQDTPPAEVGMMGSRLFSRALARPRLGRFLLGKTVGDKADPAVLETNRQMFAATPARVRADCFRSSRGMDLRLGLASVPVPALVLAGEADKIISPELGEVIARTMPQARFRRVAGAGHMLPLEAPGQVAQAIHELASG